MAVDDSIRIECFNCKTHKPLSEFHNDKVCVKRHGKTTRCKACSKQQRAEWWINNKVAASARHKDWLANNEDRVREYQTAYDKGRAEQRKEYGAGRREQNCAIAKRYRERHPDRVRLTTKSYYESNTDKVKAACANYRKNNPSVLNARSAERKARLLMATPAWANAAAIFAIYAEASASNLHVDHIVPLRSRLVCGLHCEANLQLLSQSENSSKSNKHWPDMPN